MEEQTRKSRNSIYLMYAVVFVLILIILGVASTYAYFRVETTKSETISTITASTDCVNISYSETDAMDLDYQYPISDTYAIQNVTPINVTVTNNCTNNTAAVNYTLTLTALSMVPEQGEDNEYISDNKIRIRVLKKIGNNTETEFKSANYVNSLTRLYNGNTYDYMMAHMTNNNAISVYDNKNVYRIDSNTIANNTIITYKIQLWIDYYEGDSAMYTEQNPVHNTDYDNSTENLNYKAMIALVVNPDTATES